MLDIEQALKIIVSHCCYRDNYSGIPRTAYFKHCFLFICPCYSLHFFLPFLLLPLICLCQIWDSWLVAIFLLLPSFLGVKRTFSSQWIWLPHASLLALQSVSEPQMRPWSLCSTVSKDLLHPAQMLSFLARDDFRWGDPHSPIKVKARHYNSQWEKARAFHLTPSVP